MFIMRPSSGELEERALAAVTFTDAAHRLLGECLLFRELEPEERETLFTKVRVCSYAGGETIFLMGSVADSLIVVLTGSVRISVPSPDGGEIVLAMIPPLEIFGEIALLDGKGRTADAQAIGPCTLAIIERRQVLSFLTDHPKMWPRLMDVLCARLRNTDQHIAEIALLELPARLAKTLLRFAIAEKHPTGRGALRVEVSQGELGKICGSTRESINKCLGGWQRRGIIEIEDGIILVINRTALDELAVLAEPSNQMAV